MVYDQTFFKQIEIQYRQAIILRRAKTESFQASILRASSEHTDDVLRLRTAGIVTKKGLLDRSVILSLGKTVDRLISRKENLECLRDHEGEWLANRESGDPIHFDGRKMDFSTVRQKTSGIAIVDPFVTIPNLLDIALDDRLVDVAVAYFNCLPLIPFVKVRKSFAHNLPPVDTQLFHTDLNSYHIIKVIIYLNDVDADGGPFTYVRTSHSTAFRELFGKHQSSSSPRFSDEEIIEKYGLENVVECPCRAGDVIFCDTTGFHKGKKPTALDRNVIIINYCVHEESGFQYDKIKIKKDDFHKLSERKKSLVDHLERV